MDVIRLHETQLKHITEFIIEKKVIFHPVISPRGCPDFSSYYDKKFVLILDRNIMTKIVELCINGSLNDDYLLKIVSSLLFWSEFNGVSVTGGVALQEYAHNKKSDAEASAENNIFLKLFDQYSPTVWLELAIGKTKTIPKLELPEVTNHYIFNVSSEHYKMHFVEMLHIMSLYLKNDMTKEEKIIEFIGWVDKNLLFCCYTIIYVCLLFSKQIKQPKQNKIDNIDSLLLKCSNQAWDLTYLSLWSTLYWYEDNDNTIYLFSTMDNDLKKIFIHAHDTSTNVFVRFFGQEKGDLIIKEYNRILSKRVKPNINSDKLDILIESEKNALRALV